MFDGWRWEEWEGIQVRSSLSEQAGRCMSVEAVEWRWFVWTKREGKLGFYRAPRGRQNLWTWPGGDGSPWRV